MSKVTIASDSSEMIKSFELIGELTPEIARICSPNAHRLLNLALYYEDCLPETPKTIIAEIEGEAKQVTVQKGDIINSPRLRAIIDRSFWFEFNKTMREKLPELKMMMIASAVERSLKIGELRELSKREKEINKYLKDNLNISLKEILEKIDEEEGIK